MAGGILARHLNKYHLEEDIFNEFQQKGVRKWGNKFTHKSGLDFNNEKQNPCPTSHPRKITERDGSVTCCTSDRISPVQPYGPGFIALATPQCVPASTATPTAPQADPQQAVVVDAPKATNDNQIKCPLPYPIYVQAGRDPNNSPAECCSPDRLSAPIPGALLIQKDCIPASEVHCYNLGGGASSCSYHPDSIRNTEMTITETYAPGATTPIITATAASQSTAYSVALATTHSADVEEHEFASDSESIEGEDTPDPDQQATQNKSADEQAAKDKADKEKSAREQVAQEKAAKEAKAKAHKEAVDKAYKEAIKKTAKEAADRIDARKELRNKPGWFSRETAMQAWEAANNATELVVGGVEKAIDLALSPLARVTCAVAFAIL